MPMNPGADEGEREFISRCIKHEVEAGHPQDQAAAICYSYWRKGEMARSLRPHAGEYLEAFIGRFMQHHPEATRAHAVAWWKLGPEG